MGRALSGMFHMFLPIRWWVDSLIFLRYFMNKRRGHFRRMKIGYLWYDYFGVPQVEFPEKDESNKNKNEEKNEKQEEENNGKEHEETHAENNEKNNAENN